MEDSGCGGCLGIIILIAIAYYALGWLSVLIFNYQGWFYVLGFILIVVSAFLGMRWYLLKIKNNKMNEIYKNLSDNWR